MTFGEFKNTVSLTTKLQVHNRNGEFLGWYNVDQFIRCDHCTVLIFWAIDPDRIGITLDID